MKIRYVGDMAEYDCSLAAIKSNVIEVTSEALPRKTGFEIIIGKDVLDYKAFSTIYRKISDDTVQYSDDGSFYIEPPKPIPVEPDPEVEEPIIEEITLEERVADIEDAIIELFELMEGE